MARQFSMVTSVDPAARRADCGGLFLWLAQGARIS
jgi:hypothetical protein